MSFARDIATLSDGELASLIGASPGDAGDAEAALYARFVRRVRLYGLRHLGDDAQADDLAQRVLMVTLAALREGRVREPDRIASFVLGTARMTVRNIRREGAREVAMSDALPAFAATGTRWPVPLARDHLARCLGELKERDRTVVVLTFYEERSSGDIASSLGTTAGNVRVIRHRAIARLRRCMRLDEEAA